MPFLRFVALILACSLLDSPAFAADSPPLDPQLRQRAEHALQQGAAWLLAQQVGDGLWHSATYGQLRGGAGTSALALYSLAGAWPRLSAAEQAQVRRGIQTLIGNLDPAGFVRAPDGSSDYPNYATALTILALERAALTEYTDQQQRMRSYLVAVQHPNGGWDQTGGDPADLASTRQPNISVTRYVLEALQGSPAGSPRTSTRGVAFVSRLQHDDPKAPDHGSFHFNFPADDPLNKAGWREIDGTKQARGYGPPTADGVVALLAGGVSRDDPRVQTAVRWLANHGELDFIPGIPADDPEVAASRQALLFYYYAALAAAIKKGHSAELSQRTAPLIEQLLTLQKPDGSWASPSNFMREDDPLIATPLALEALATLLPPH